MLTRFLLPLALCLNLSACGVAYISPGVTPETTAAGLKVRVVPITAETTLVANRAPYTPKSVPAAFRRSATAGLSRPPPAEAPEPVFAAVDRPAPAALRRPPAVPERPYALGIGDVLLFASPAAGSTVEQLTGLLAAQNARQGFTIQDDGAIAIPNVGRVTVAGMTLEEAESSLFRRLVESGIEPAFSLEVAEFNSKRVTIGGAVRQASVLPITLTPLTLGEALQLAGGITEANEELVVLRLYRDGALYQIPMPAYRADPSLQRSRLIDGDSLFVDTRFDLDLARAFFEEQITLSNFQQAARRQAVAELQTEISLRQTEIAEAQSRFDREFELGAIAQDFVYLAGEVAAQKRVALPFEQRATLADVLYGEGGGFEVKEGNPRHIYVLRGSTSPREFAGLTAYNLDAANAANLLLATRFEMRPNDIVFIAEQPVTRWNRAVSLVIPSVIVNAATGG
ncbi:MAG: polysaccharide biosynthesis/export family protein [Paracoccaceae bacterium]|nr:polysaccharide biosynthesis/export family protein [Paracoccaceae bacterium]